MPGRSRYPDQSKKEDDQERCNHARLERSIAPAEGDRLGVWDLDRTRRKGELEGVLRGADGDTLHAAGAL